MQFYFRLLLWLACCFASSCSQKIDTPVAVDQKEFAGPVEQRRTFALRAGDRLEFIIGGRLIVDEVVSKELTAKASYEVMKAQAKVGENRYEVQARYEFQPVSHEIDPEILKPLFVSRLLPFSKIMEGATETGTALFATDLTVLESQAKGFPFFDFAFDDANKQSSPFLTSSEDFRRIILELDPEAQIRIQAATGLFEAYFVDKRVEPNYLHELRYTLSPFGFYLNFEERVCRYVPGMRRVAADMREAELAAVFPGPVKISRDGETFVCSLFARRCKSVSRENICLPTDPEAKPAPC